MTCDFCFRRCRLSEGRRGPCGVREAGPQGVVTLGWGQVLPPAVDPVEKKPFYHFRPGDPVLSLAMLGCNFTCDFCQNYSISQPGLGQGILTKALNPEEIGQWMEDTGTRTVAYTYSEPTVWQDFMISCAREVIQRQGVNLMVTNGSFTPEARKRILPYIHGFNVDLKGGPVFYKKYCQGAYDVVLENIQALAQEPDKVLEVTTLYQAHRHTREELADLARDLDAAGVQVWHLSLFFPAYKQNQEAPTSEAEALEVYRELRSLVGIPYIYLGNSQGAEGLDTRCPRCGRPGIHRRRPFGAHSALNPGGRCAHCGETIYGRFD